MTRPCYHPVDSQRRLAGGVYTYCCWCGALKKHGLNYWRRPQRDELHVRSGERQEAVQEVER